MSAGQRPASGGPNTIITALAVDLSVLSREVFVWGGANKRRVIEVADRMLANLVRLRGQLGDAPVLLTAGQYDTVVLALDDAEVLHRTSGDPDQADAYRKTAGELWQEADQ